MIRALLYLQGVSLRNAVGARLRRLRQPKYLAGGIAGALYFYAFFFRRLFDPHGGYSGRYPGMDPLGFVRTHAALIESGAALALAVVVACGWILPQSRAALAFTEAEVAFLFPAPVGRKTLIHYKLLKSQARILISALLLTLISGRFGVLGGNAWTHAFGWWVIFSTLNLHFLGASFARTRLLDLGVTTVRRRAVALALVAAGVLATFLWLRHALPPPTRTDLAGGSAFARYAETALGAGPLPWLLWPFRLVVRPFLAAGAPAFFLAAGPALLLLLAHYFWVARSDTAFEEASLALAQKRGERLAAFREGRGRGARTPAKPRRPPFALAPAGPAPVAFLWKNLLSAGPVFRARPWLATAALILLGCAWLGGDPSWRALLPVVGALALGLSVWLLLAGPQFFRQDLRQDLPNADILKVYPLRGWQIVLGELLAPVVILTALQWLLLLAAARSIPIGALDAACLAVVVPFGYALLLLIPNAAVLFFPSWAQTARTGGRGLEMMGQRLIFFAAQLVVFVVAVLPAALAGGVVFFAAHWLFGPAVAPPAGALVVVTVLAGEITAALAWLGMKFERFDLSAELAR